MGQLQDQVEGAHCDLPGCTQAFVTVAWGSLGASGLPRALNKRAVGRARPEPGLGVRKGLQGGMAGLKTLGPCGHPHPTPTVSPSRSLQQPWRMPGLALPGICRVALPGPHLLCSLSSVRDLTQFHGQGTGAGGPGGKRGFCDLSVQQGADSKKP